jgi:hypothetical protein
MRNDGDGPRDPYLLGSLHKGLEVIDVISAKPRAGPHFVLAPTRAGRIQAMCEPTG